MATNRKYHPFLPIYTRSRFLDLATFGLASEAMRETCNLGFTRNLQPEYLCLTKISQRIWCTLPLHKIPISQAVGKTVGFVSEIRRVDGRQARRSDTNLGASSRTAEARADLGCFRRPVVRGDGVPVSLSPTTGASWTGGRNRNEKQGCGGASVYRTRPHGRDLPAERSRSPVPSTPVARESAASTALQGCPYN